MKPLTFTLLLFTLLPCIACGRSATEELDGTATPVPDTSAIIATVERNLATMDEALVISIESGDTVARCPMMEICPLVDIRKITRLGINALEGHEAFVVNATCP